jgi:hypothetical protein
LASLSRKVMNELRRSLGAKATPAWRLSTALTTSVQRGVPSGFAWSTVPPPRVAAQREDVRLGRRGGGEPRLGQPRLQERARRGGHGGGARAEDGRRLVRVGRAQVELEAATASRAWLEGDAQLELARATATPRAARFCGALTEP